jgi:hypothetical protein
MKAMGKIWLAIALVLALGGCRFGSTAPEANTTTEINASTGGDNNASAGQEDNGSIGGGDDNATVGGGDDNGTTGGQEDNATTGGQEDNATTGGGDDSNATTGGEDNGSVGDDDNASIGGDDNATVGGGDDNGTAGGDDNTTAGGDDNTTTGGDDNTMTGGTDDNASSSSGPEIIIPEETNSTLSHTTIPYARITLAVPVRNARRVQALNRTLENEDNRSIRIFGVDNNGTYYLYNIPLRPGKNRIEIKAAGSDGKESRVSLDIEANASRIVPLGMRAGRFRGVGSLTTQVEVGTALDARSYLFDPDGDGVIDTTHPASEGNFTVSLRKEGRYFPRVTVRTREGLLFSSDAYALALDVVADADQKDPKGAQPIDVAKEFVQALMEDDRAKVERLVAENRYMMKLLYGNDEAIKILKTIYPKIKNMKAKENMPDGRASITYTFDVNGTTYGGGMELHLINEQLYKGRYWFVRFIY